MKLFHRKPRLQASTDGTNHNAPDHRRSQSKPETKIEAVFVRSYARELEVGEQPIPWLFLEPVRPASRPPNNYSVTRKYHLLGLALTPAQVDLDLKLWESTVEETLDRLVKYVITSSFDPNKQERFSLTANRDERYVAWKKQHSKDPKSGHLPWPDLSKPHSKADTEMAIIQLLCGMTPSKSAVFDALQSRDKLLLATLWYYGTDLDQSEQVKIINDKHYHAQYNAHLSPLHSTIASSDIASLTLLLEFGANPNPGHSPCPLELALRGSELEMIKVLLFFDFDPMPLSEQLAEYVIKMHGQPPMLPTRLGPDYTVMEKIMAINAADPLKVARSGKIMIEFLQKRRREEEKTAATPSVESELTLATGS